MIELDNQTDIEFDITLLNKISKKLTSKNIELIFTTDKEIQKLNKEHRGIDTPTDVLSFPLDFQDITFAHMPLGSIVISVEYAYKKAKEFKHSLEEELSLLFIHGLLHLLGYNHEADLGEQRAKEEKLIKEFSLPKSLIIRNC